MKGLGFVGAGNMGEAMIRGILAAKLIPPREVVVLDVRPERGKELGQRFGVSVARGWRIFSGSATRSCLRSSRKE
ncbi:MAG: NAD(P)-binding domain-containing protein [Candidatus Deferrimicrobiaceae bacterium]